jgi:hypothetical protein
MLILQVHKLQLNTFNIPFSCSHRSASYIQPRAISYPNWKAQQLPCYIQFRYNSVLNFHI